MTEDLGAAFERACEQHADRIAVVELDRGVETLRYTYGELGAEARRFAALLADAGFTTSDRLAIVLPNQARWIASAIGALWAGGALVPIDARLFAQEQATLIAYVRPRALVTTRERYEALRAELSRDVRVFLVDEASWSAPAEPRARRARDGTATIVFSSGTGGGAPKGCVLSDDVYLGQARMLGAAFRVGVTDRYLSVLPTSHTTDFTMGFVLPLLFGASIVYEKTPRPEALSHAMRTYGVTYTALVPRLLRHFETKMRPMLAAVPDIERRIEALRDEPLRPGALPDWLAAIVEPIFGARLRLVLAGGAFVDPRLAEFFADVGVRIGVGYGLTEAGAVVAVGDPRAPHFDGAYVLLPGVEAEVREAGPDGFGAIWVRTPSLMRSYYRAPELTGRTLVDGWLFTGDVGRLDDTGRLVLVGRAKNMIVTEGGKNVYPEDVEGAFAALEGCAELCVLAERYIWPQHDLQNERLIVVVRPTSEAARFVAELERRNRALPAYKRVGGYLVWPRPFPTTGSLKPRRDRLAAELRAADDARIHPI